jgi:hypothetical protein
MKPINVLMGLAIASCLIPSAAQAKYVQTSKVRYETSEGLSKWYSVDVTFLTGSELNSATLSFKHSMFGEYAVVFWGDHKASVIKLDSLMICGTEFEQSCLPFSGRMKGPDQEGRSWEICTGSFCL